MGKLLETFKNRLGSALSERGATADLIRNAQISRQTIDRWISGERTPDLLQVEAAAKALGKSPIDLLFPGELPRAPEPNHQEIVSKFIEMLAEITETVQGEKMLSEAIGAVVKNVRVQKNRRLESPKEKG